MCAKPVCEVVVSGILRYYTTLQFCGIHLLEWKVLKMGQERERKREREKTTKESCQKWARWYLAKQSREVTCRWTWYVRQKVTHCRCTFSVSQQWTQFFFLASWTLFLSSKLKKNGRSRLYTAKKVPQKSIESNASCMIEQPGCPEPRARAVVIQLVYYMKPSLEQHAILELWPRWLDYRRLEYPGGRGAGWVMSKGWVNQAFLLIYPE